MARPEAQASSTQSIDSSEVDDPSLPEPDIPAFAGMPLAELRVACSPVLGRAIDRVVADLNSPEEVTAGFDSNVT